MELVRLFGGVALSLVSLTAALAAEPTAAGWMTSFEEAQAQSRSTGKPLLLHFYADWCGPCKIEMPWFVEFQRQYKDKGFTVLAVSLDDDIDPVAPFVEKYELNFPVVWGDEETADKFGGIAALPTTLIIDRQGNVVDSHTGLVGKAIYVEQIESLL